MQVAEKVFHDRETEEEKEERRQKEEEEREIKKEKHQELTSLDHLVTWSEHVKTYIK